MQQISDGNGNHSRHALSWRTLLPVNLERVRLGHTHGSDDRQKATKRRLWCGNGVNARASLNENWSGCAIKSAWRQALPSFSPSFRNILQL